MGELVPDPKNSLLKLSDDLPGIVALYDVNLLDLAIQRSGFTVVDEWEILTNIFLDESKKATDRIAANKQRREIVKDILKLNGHIQTATHQQTSTMPDGTVVNQRLITTRLLNTLKANNEQERSNQEYLVRDGYRPPLLEAQGNTEGTPAPNSPAVGADEGAGEDQRPRSGSSGSSPPPSLGHLRPDPDGGEPLREHREVRSPNPSGNLPGRNQPEAGDDPSP